MTNYPSVAEIEQQAKSPHITAEELDILVSKTRDISQIKQRELDRVTRLLAELEQKLEQSQR